MVMPMPVRPTRQPSAWRDIQAEAAECVVVLSYVEIPECQAREVHGTLGDRQVWGVRSVLTRRASSRISVISATSWIVREVLQTEGSLNRRVTHSLCIRPFSLRECEEYLRNDRGIEWSRQQVIEAYMVFGESSGPWVDALHV